MEFNFAGTAQVHSRRARPVPSAIPWQPRARLANVPLAVALLLVTILLPREFDFTIAGLRLSCQRLVLIVWFPLALMRIVQGRGVKLRGFDLLFISAFTYYAIVVFAKEPLERAIVAGGIYFLEAVGGYLIARVYIRNEAQFLATVKLLFWMVFVAVTLAIPESLFGSHLARNIAAGLTGNAPPPLGESRLGLLRPYSVFDHPIHYGVFCVAVFSLIWFSEANLVRRLARAGLALLATIVSLSAGPIQGVILIMGGALWERLTRNIPSRAWATIVAGTILYLVVALLTKRSPFNILVSSFVFDSASVYYRMLIWDYGVDNVLNNPWIGLPLGSWERPEWMVSASVDNHWLTIALWGGLPALVLYLLSIVALMRAVHRGRHRWEQPQHRRCRFAWSATVLALCAIGATVNYWGTLGVFFNFCLGLGAWLVEAKDGDARAPRTSVVPVRQAASVTRSSQLKMDV